MEKLSLDVPTVENQDTLDFDSTYRVAECSIARDQIRVDGHYLEGSVLRSDIEIGRRIGSGACSFVHIARHRKNDERYAVKYFNIYDRERREQLGRELSILVDVRCDALISFHGAFHVDGNIGMILEYMDCGSLDGLVNQNMKIPEEILASIAYQILWGLAFLHFDKNVHRDLKPGNVLLHSDGSIKLSDFGLLKSFGGDKSFSAQTFTGTFKYMSPERLDGNKYRASSDIWSLGVMLMELWEGKYPFERGTYNPLELLDVLENTKTMNFFPVDKYPETMREAMAAMIAFNGEMRETSENLLECNWIKKLNIDSLEVAKENVHKWMRSQDKLMEKVAKAKDFAPDSKEEFERRRQNSFEEDFKVDLNRQNSEERDIGYGLNTAAAPRDDKDHGYANEYNLDSALDSGDYEGNTTSPSVDSYMDTPKLHHDHANRNGGWHSGNFTNAEGKDHKT